MGQAFCGGGDALSAMGRIIVLGCYGMKITDSAATCLRRCLYFMSLHR